MTMRESMARAICKYIGVDPDAKPTSNELAPNWIGMLGVVDAALDCLTMPTPMMVEAAMESTSLKYAFNRPSPEKIAEVFAALIRIYIKEGRK